MNIKALVPTLIRLALFSAVYAGVSYCLVVRWVFFPSGLGTSTEGDPNSPVYIDEIKKFNLIRVVQPEWIHGNAKYVSENWFKYEMGGRLIILSFLWIIILCVTIRFRIRRMALRNG
jgi:hypothetical protein